MPPVLDLPDEILSKILQILVQWAHNGMRPGQKPPVCHVSKQFYRCAEPLAFHTLSFLHPNSVGRLLTLLDEGEPSPITGCSVADLISTATQHMLMSILPGSSASYHAASSVFPLCKNLKSLRIRVLLDDEGEDSELVEKLLHMLGACGRNAPHLTHVAVNFEIRHLDQIQGTFRNLTHLEIDRHQKERSLNVYLDLPNLTHVLLWVLDDPYIQGNDKLDIPSGILEDLRMFPRSLRLFLLAFDLRDPVLEEDFFPPGTALAVLRMTSPDVVLGLLSGFLEHSKPDFPPNLVIPDLLKRYEEASENAYLEGKDVWEIAEAMVLNRRQSSPH